MSVCNILFAADAVHLLTDTMSYRADGTPYGLSPRKAEVAEGGAFIWACRGSVFLGSRLDKVLANGVGSLAEAEALIRLYLDTLPADTHEITGQRLGDQLLEVTLAGWDDQVGDLVARRITGCGGALSTTVEYTRGTYVSPGPKAGWRGPETITEGQFIQMAVAQHSMQQKLKGIGGPGLCIGGIMHITTVSRSSAEQRIVGLYPDYQEHASTLGDPNAEAVAAFLSNQKVAA